MASKSWHSAMGPHTGKGQGTLMLVVVVVNSIKLHLTAFKRELSIETLVIH